MSNNTYFGMDSFKRDSSYCNSSGIRYTTYGSGVESEIIDSLGYGKTLKPTIYNMRVGDMNTYINTDIPASRIKFENGISLEEAFNNIREIRKVLPSYVGFSFGLKRGDFLTLKPNAGCD